MPSNSDMCLGTQVRSCPNNINARMASCKNETITETKECQLYVAGTWSEWSDCKDGESIMSKQANICDQKSKVETKNRICETPEVFIKSAIHKGRDCDWSEWSSCLESEGYRKVRVRECDKSIGRNSDRQDIEFKNCEVIAPKREKQNPKPSRWLINFPNVQLKHSEMNSESREDYSKPPAWPGFLPSFLSSTFKYWRTNPTPKPQEIYPTKKSTFEFINRNPGFQPQPIPQVEFINQNIGYQSQPIPEVEYVNHQIDAIKYPSVYNPIPEISSSSKNYVTQTNLASDNFWKPTMRKNGQGLPPISIIEPSHDEPFTDIYPPQTEVFTNPTYPPVYYPTYSQYYPQTTQTPTSTSTKEVQNPIWGKSFTLAPKFSLPEKCKYSITSPCSEHHRKFKIVICENPSLERQVHKNGDGVHWTNCDQSESVSLITDWDPKENPWQYSTALRSNTSPISSLIYSPEEANTEPNWTKFYTERSIPEDNLINSNYFEGSGEADDLPFVDVRQSIQLKLRKQNEKVTKKCIFKEVPLTRSLCINGKKRISFLVNQCTKEVSYNVVAC